MSFGGKLKYLGDTVAMQFFCSVERRLVCGCMCPLSSHLGPRSLAG